MNYLIIANEGLLDQFINWLPETTDRFQYYVSLFARKKYAPSHPALVHDKTVLKRFTCKKENLKEKLKQLECPFGAYTGKDGRAIPLESTAVYISPSPRDLRKAAFKTLQQLSLKLEKDDDFNPRSVVMNSIQISHPKDKTLVFDIDSKDEELLRKLCAVVVNHCTVISTRGGFHILITAEDLKNVEYFEKNWYQTLSKAADVTGDALVPIVGTLQGGTHVPFFYDL